MQNPIEVSIRVDTEFCSEEKYYRMTPNAAHAIEWFIDAYGLEEYYSISIPTEHVVETLDF